MDGPGSVLSAVRDELQLNIKGATKDNPDPSVE